MSCSPINDQPTRAAAPRTSVQVRFPRRAGTVHPGLGHECPRPRGGTTMDTSLLDGRAESGARRFTRDEPDPVLARERAARPAPRRSTRDDPDPAPARGRAARRRAGRAGADMAGAGAAETRRAKHDRARRLEAEATASAMATLVAHENARAERAEHKLR